MLVKGKTTDELQTQNLPADIVAKKQSLWGVLKGILQDNWQWRKQIGQLAIFELKKQARGAVLGWAWLAIKPIVYIIVFWFALEVGLRAGSSNEGSYPYFVWLVSGLIPWFFMSPMFSTGSDVLHRYSYLVNKVKFPLSGISSLYCLSQLLIDSVLFVLLLVIYTAYGMPWDIYMLQIPLLLVLLFAFWDVVSIMNSQLSGISRDFGHLMKALSQPFFWLSGVIFNMTALEGAGFGWVNDLMLLNPVTFFCTGFRDALCHKVWIWDDPAFFGAFVLVFILTLILMLIVYRHFNEEVSDAL